MTPDWPALLAAAAAVRERAHAPYSGYRVGAAVLTADGSTHVGTNVENASYGLTMCAERTAAGTAVAAGTPELVACAIVAGGEDLPMPCGACRQVLMELGGPDLLCAVARVEDLEHPTRFRLGDLLPHAFRLNPPPA